MAPLEVPENSEFFISLCKYDNHSFVTLGFMDKDDRPEILAQVGKFGDYKYNETIKNSNQLYAFFYLNLLAIKLLFYHIDAVFTDEPTFKRKTKITPKFRKYNSYQAYSITSSQYHDFLSLIDGIVPKICAYRSDPTVPNTMKYGPNNNENGSDAQVDFDLQTSCAQLSITNTCRHTAILLLEHVLDIQKLPDSTSRLFFQDLAVSCPNMHRTYYYRWPIPPKKNDYGHKQYAILSKIYKQMEHLVEKDPNGEATINKFKALKELYSEQHAIFSNKTPSETQDSLGTALNNILEWKINKMSVIEVLREQSFFGKIFNRTASTVTMVDDIERMLKP